MKVLYELIHARAAQDWTDPVNVTNYNLYAAHWIETARLLANEFEENELPETAKALRLIAEQQERFT